MDHLEQSAALRSGLTSEQRLADGYLGIDPGFVHQRMIETIVGPKGMMIIDRQIAELPRELPDWQKRVRIDHIFTRLIVEFCRLNEIPTLGRVLAQGNGRLFSSVEDVAPCPDIYEHERVVARIQTPGFEDYRVELHFSASRVTSDTVKSRLHDGSEHAVIALYHTRKGTTLIFEPLVIGAPWLYSQSDALPEDEAMWWGHAIGEVFIEDIDEFARAAEMSISDEWLVMEDISESAVKQMSGRAPP